MSYGGPIIKNKTFFYAVYDQLLNTIRDTVSTTVLTPCARNGIFRYFDSGAGKASWNNGNAAQVLTLGATPTIAVVDVLGNPKAPANNSDNSPFTGALRYASVFGQPNTSIDSTSLWTYADAISWTKGRHAFKGGGEVRLSRSKSSADGFFGGAVLDSTYARALGGELTTSLVAGINSTNMPGLAGTTNTGNRGRMEDLLTFLAGSLGSVNERYFINSPKLDAWDDFRVSPYINRDFRQKEFSFFFKDDWKVHKDLTLNLGVRYEYYGVPYVANGMTIAPAGGGAALFGYSGRGFTSWMKPASLDNQGRFVGSPLTQLEFVGPNSTHSDKSLWSADWNNFGPAVGFAWQIPWFGEGKTLCAADIRSPTRAEDGSTTSILRASAARRAAIMPRATRDSIPTRAFKNSISI